MHEERLTPRQHTPRRRSQRALYISMLCIIVGPFVARAQGGGSIGVIGSALQPSSRFAAGSVAGLGPAVSVSLGEWTSLEAGLLFYSGDNLESDLERRYRLMVPSLTVRATIIDGRTQLAALIGGGAMRYHLHALNEVPATSRLIPSAHLGLALRMQLLSSVAIEISGRDWMSYVRTNEFGTTPGRRGLAHSFEFRIGLAGIFRRRTVPAARIEDYPLAYLPNYRPVDVTAVRFDPAKTDQGRKHMHETDGTIVDLKVVSPRVFAGVDDPGTTSQLTATRPGIVYDQRLVGTIFFATDSSVVTQPYRLVLEEVAQYITAHPTATLELRAFTDRAGVQHENVALSERRGTTVKEILVRLYGVRPERISSVALGVDFKTSADSLARRVELRALIPRVPSPTRAQTDGARTGKETGTLKHTEPDSRR